MKKENTTGVHKELVKEFRAASVYRPMHIDRFEPGTELTYDITGVPGSNKGKVYLIIEKFVGGGFAGQVYRVKVLGIEFEAGPIEGIEVGGFFAIKILIPPSGFSRLFRNLLTGSGSRDHFSFS